MGNKITPTTLEGIRQMSQPFKRPSAQPGLGTHCLPKEASFAHCFLGFGVELQFWGTGREFPGKGH